MIKFNPQIAYSGIEGDIPIPIGFIANAFFILLLIKKIGSFMDKFFGYSYFIFRLPIYYILKVFFKRDKDLVNGHIKGCKDFFLKKY